MVRGTTKKMTSSEYYDSTKNIIIDDMYESKINRGKVSRKALQIAFKTLGHKVKKSIHPMAITCSDSLLRLAIDMIQVNIDDAVKLYTNGEIEVDGKMTSSVVTYVRGWYDKQDIVPDDIERLIAEPETGIVLNDGQDKALRAALSAKDNLFITGSPGTGKTVVLSQVAKQLSIESTAIVSPTHKAKNVLQDMLDKENIMTSCGTIHQYLKMSPQDNKLAEDGPTETIFVQKTDDKNYVDILLVDEISMVDDELLEMLKKQCGRVIGFGDMDQLEPVNGTSGEITSWDMVELTEQMRQELAMTSLTFAIDHYKTRVRDKSSYAPSDLQFSVDDGETYFESESLVKDYLNNEIDVILCWRNETVRLCNEAIQFELNGVTTPVVGDTLVLYEPLVKWKDGTTVVLANNGDEVKVVNIETDWLGNNVYSIETQCGNVKERMLLGRDKWDTFQHYKSKSTYKLNWGNFKNNNMLNAHLPYAQTVHKSQGSSYSKVGINMLDISASMFDMNMFNRLMYTSLSRAKKYVKYLI